MSKYISVYEYAKKNGIDSQNVYRWIRERKFKEGDTKLELVTRKRIRIKENAKHHDR